ncbi:hypothetical protein XHC_4319 [Xanthomonas hortorum pv. carotae str. M081]|nr:hypothetical protein XHC_4319 [Xanthomonas hortorum pv. carotae str. M081]
MWTERVQQQQTAETANTTKNDREGSVLPAASLASSNALRGHTADKQTA